MRRVSTPCKNVNIVIVKLENDVRSQPHHRKYSRDTQLLWLLVQKEWLVGNCMKKEE